MKQKNAISNARGYLLLGGLALAVAALSARAIYLQVLNKSFLQGQGDARHVRIVTVPAHRGMLTDRYGEPLAASTPVDSVWINPQEFFAPAEPIPVAKWSALARLLELPPDEVHRTLYDHRDSEFAYIKRQASPEVAQQVMALNIPGIALQREYRRYYPAGEVTAHVLGFTDIDDKGQEGLELAFEERLHGTNGKRKVIKDPFGRIVEEIESVKEPEPGVDIPLSIDRRVQYLAYRELKGAMQRYQARSASAVILDVRSGEVLAMVNQPAFNPNNRDELKGERFRNRAVTDVFEPGSTIKPFTIAAALESGKFRPTTMIDTSPGTFKVGPATVHDVHNYGLIDVTHVLQKSSNVGVSKMALELSAERLWDAFTRAGLGTRTASAFPGEVNGVLNHFKTWHDVERVTAAYGYGVSVTALQLAQAYATLGGDGQQRPVSFLRIDDPATVPAHEMFRPEIARKVRAMMETVTQEGGTGTEARVAGYRIAGKTGTVKKNEPGGYADHRYVALFAGVAPASRPRLAMVVMIEDPQGKEFYGGQVSAPVFSAVMAGALRLLDVAPDDLPVTRTHLAYAEARR